MSNHSITSSSCSLRRYMMLINGKNEVFMVDRDNSIFHIANLEFPFRKDPRVHLSNTLLDGVSHCSSSPSSSLLWPIMSYVDQHIPPSRPPFQKWASGLVPEKIRGSHIVHAVTPSCSSRRGEVWLIPRLLLACFVLFKSHRWQQQVQHAGVIITLP